MQTLPVIFSRSAQIGSYGIRLFDRQGGYVCPFSHVGIITEDGENVLEATLEKGVVETPITDFVDRASAVDSGYFPCLNRAAAYTRIRKELGKGYDITGVLSLGIPFFGRDWENPNAWWCSELLAHGSGIFDRQNIRTIGVAFCYALTRKET